jgi:hypothetical protein
MNLTNKKIECVWCNKNCDFDVWQIILSVYFMIYFVPHDDPFYRLVISLALAIHHPE